MKSGLKGIEDAANTNLENIKYTLYEINFEFNKNIN